MPASPSQARLVRLNAGWRQALAPFWTRRTAGRKPDIRYRTPACATMATNANVANPATTAKGLDREILDACRRSHQRIARTLLPRHLEDLSQWQELSPAERQVLPRHAALGGFLGRLLPQAAFHLGCPSVEIFRVKPYLTGTGQEAAVAALEMAQAHWGETPPDQDKAWWLHIWARRFLEDGLAASAWGLSGRRESVVRAMWSSTPNRILTDGPPGADRQRELGVVRCPGGTG